MVKESAALLSGFVLTSSPPSWTASNAQSAVAPGEPSKGKGPTTESSSAGSSSPSSPSASSQRAPGQQPLVSKEGGEGTYACMYMLVQFLGQALGEGRSTLPGSTGSWKKIQTQSQPPELIKSQSPQGPHRSHGQNHQSPRHHLRQGSNMNYCLMYIQMYIY